MLFITGKVCARYAIVSTVSYLLVIDARFANRADLALTLDLHPPAEHRKSSMQVVLPRWRTLANQRKVFGQ